MSVRPPEKRDRGCGGTVQCGRCSRHQLELAEAALKSAVDQIERDQGRLDMLVNNAGIALLGDSHEIIGCISDEPAWAGAACAAVRTASPQVGSGTHGQCLKRCGPILSTLPAIV